LGSVPGFEVPEEDEGALAEERVGVAGRDDGLGASLRGIVSLGGPIFAEPLDAALFAFLVVAE
jgi:hypothetical protein